MWRVNHNCTQGWKKHYCAEAVEDTLPAQRRWSGSGGEDGVHQGHALGSVCFLADTYWSVLAWGAEEVTLFARIHRVIERRQTRSVVLGPGAQLGGAELLELALNISVPVVLAHIREDLPFSNLLGAVFLLSEYIFYEGFALRHPEIYKRGARS